MAFIAQGSAGMLGDLGGLVAGATLLGKIVLLILFAMSVFSWALMVERGRRLVRAARGNARFWEQFLPAREDGAGLRRLGAWAEQHGESPLAAVYLHFSREILPAAFGQASSPERLRTLGEVLARSVDRIATAEMGKLERGLSWLATFTSTAPFIGLLGTVYGILTSFLEIGRQGSASLDAVGPGIAESLVATVAGLGVAIPAAVAYNYFVGKLKQQDADLQALGAHLSDLLAREDLHLDAAQPLHPAGRAQS
jgi:biopolymer transport protein TolQ